MANDITASIDRLTAYTETHERARVDDLVNGEYVSVPAPDRISGHGDGTELLFSDLKKVLEVARSAQ
ncbi:hypothetical protein ACIBI0_38465 [Microbispora rosea]|uniref:hypothetical protein n=1 Tax=Microbispora rosea TaxID=58117 RepID=UPI0037BCE8E1